MKVFKKTPTTSSPKEDATTSKKVDVTAKKVDVTAKKVDVTAKKVDTTGFNKAKEKMAEDRKEGFTGNFRQRAEHAGVPSARVIDFKYWLTEHTK